MKKISILGSTGSIGVSALDVIGRNPDRFKVVALSAGKNIRRLVEQIERFNPQVVSVLNKKDALALRKAVSFRNKIKVYYGAEGLGEVASWKDADTVISAISGFAGLMPTVTAIEAGKNIALANKETMVAAGQIVTQMAKEKSIQIVPVDSEHSAIFQCLRGEKRRNLSRLILTASGGPFFKLTDKQMKRVTLSQALKHPNWRMGEKITIDSASMMNKGLEVIEAKWLFDVEMKHIDVLVHPQSIVHSLVELRDGTCLAQLGVPDMKTPIAYALTYPDRMTNNLPRLDLSTIGKLEFIAPDFKKFPCLRLAYEAGSCGGTVPAVLNASDEVAVAAFIRGTIGFTDLAVIIEETLSLHNRIDRPSLSDIIESDRWARKVTEKIIKRMKR